MINAAQSDIPGNFTPIQVTKAPSMSDSPVTPPAPAPLAPKKNSRWKLLLGVLGLVLLLVGGGAAYWLSQQGQDIRQQASSDVYEAGQTCGTQGATACQPDATKLVCQNYVWTKSGSCLTVEIWELQ